MKYNEALLSEVVDTVVEVQRALPFAKWVNQTRVVARRT